LPPVKKKTFETPETTNSIADVSVGLR